MKRVHVRVHQQLLAFFPSRQSKHAQLQCLFTLGCDKERTDHSLRRWKLLAHCTCDLARRACTESSGVYDHVEKKLYIGRSLNAHAVGADYEESTITCQTSSPFAVRSCSCRKSLVVLGEPGDIDKLRFREEKEHGSRNDHSRTA